MCGRFAENRRKRFLQNGLASTWRKCPGWRPKDGEPMETFTILTTDPNEVMEPIHNRMPVILDPKDFDRWLDAGDPARPPVDLLRPFPAERMCAWSVSNRVGNVRINEPSLLDAAVPGQLQNQLPLNG